MKIRPKRKNPRKDKFKLTENLLELEYFTIELNQTEINSWNFALDIGYKEDLESELDYIIDNTFSANELKNELNSKLFKELIQIYKGHKEVERKNKILELNKYPILRCTRIEDFNIENLKKPRYNKKNYWNI